MDGAVLSQIPGNLMSQATRFNQSESLQAGRIAQNLTFTRFEDRISE